MSVSCSGPMATAICIINGYDRCDRSTGKCVHNDGIYGTSAMKNTGGRLKNRIDNQRNRRLPGFDNSQPQSQPYRVSMTASSPSIGPAAGVIGFDGTISDELNKKKGSIMAKWAYLGAIAGLIGTYSYLGLMKKDKGSLVIASLFTIGGLALGSQIGIKKVNEYEQKI